MMEIEKGRSQETKKQTEIEMECEKIKNIYGKERRNKRKEKEGRKEGNKI